MTRAGIGAESRDSSSDNMKYPSEQRKILLGRRAAAFGLSSILFLATLLWTASYGMLPSPGAARDASPRLLTGIDPNTARWFEFAQLPGIGEALAKRMADFRQRSRSSLDPSAPAFRAPADLALVRGIGEKTVRRIGPFLRF